MRASGVLEKTIVVVTSDHGESFGESGYMQHGPRVDDAVMRVPLIVRLPRRHPDSSQGLSIGGLVRTVDIMPTVLHAVGAPLPQNLDGVSLLSVIGGAPLPELWAYGESGRSFVELDDERYLVGVEGKHRMVRSLDWKLVWCRVPRTNFVCTDSPTSTKTSPHTIPTKSRSSVLISNGSRPASASLPERLC